MPFATTIRPSASCKSPTAASNTLRQTSLQDKAVHKHTGRIDGEIDRPAPEDLEQNRAAEASQAVGESSDEGADDGGDHELSRVQRRIAGTQIKRVRQLIAARAVGRRICNSSLRNTATTRTAARGLHPKPPRLPTETE